VNDEDGYVTDRERERRERQREASEHSRERTASTINEVCKRNHVCRDFIYGQIRAGRLKATKFGRVTRIFSDDEEAWQNSLPRLGDGAAA
jgi:excisionase family DNA binding protein